MSALTQLNKSTVSGETVRPANRRPAAAPLRDCGETETVSLPAATCLLRNPQWQERGIQQRPATALHRVTACGAPLSYTVRPPYRRLRCESAASSMCEPDRAFMSPLLQPYWVTASGETVSLPPSFEFWAPYDRPRCRVLVFSVPALDRASMKTLLQPYWVIAHGGTVRSRVRLPYHQLRCKSAASACVHPARHS